MKNQLTPVLPGAPDQDNQGKKHGPNSLSNSPSHLQETDGAGGGNSGISDKKEDQEDRASLSDKKTKDSFTTRAKNFLKTVKDYIRGNKVTNFDNLESQEQIVASLDDKLLREKGFLPPNSKRGISGDVAGKRSDSGPGSSITSISGARGSGLQR